MVCGNFILPEPASYVFFYAFSNLRNLLYIIAGCLDFFKANYNPVIPVDDVLAAVNESNARFPG